MTDFERFKKALVDGGRYKVGYDVQIYDWIDVKHIYIFHYTNLVDLSETCFEFDGEGKLIKID
jgi:hypothetical protein